MKFILFGVTVSTLFFFVVTFMGTGCDAPSVAEKRICVVFRYDDYSARSSTVTELRIIDLFRMHRAAVTFSVIPFVCSGDIHDPSPMDTIALTPQKADILKRGLEAGVLDIALHGYSHQTIDAAQMKEFSGLDYGIQLAKLFKGRQFLEQITDARLTTFVPPWNRYDLNTLRALETAGFSTISAGRHGPAPQDIGLIVLPATCGIGRLREAVLAARASRDPRPILVVLFHEYDFKEVNRKRGKITYQGFSNLLGWLESQQDIRLLSIQQAVETMAANREEIR